MKPRSRRIGLVGAFVPCVAAASAAGVSTASSPGHRFAVDWALCPGSDQTLAAQRRELADTAVQSASPSRCRRRADADRERTHDPSTAYRWAYGLAAQIHASVILTREGDGHTSYYTSACAQAAADIYLVSRTAPAAQVCTS
jgi:TAP-like protein